MICGFANGHTPTVTGLASELMRQRASELAALADQSDDLTERHALLLEAERCAQLAKGLAWLKTTSGGADLAAGPEEPAALEPRRAQRIGRR